ncbi:glycosyl hydrolase [Aspergillus bombycis]|uniref:Glycosyl hydrolase n=1 Tax=Aspergillus bombycis TaxID=109264 RepID=A0A1F8A6Z3_9EURO|nr:glycosyl hydrolase [Aspergillus bombycis]OGM47464.1 glycosyl hydrolase [Aspergillus bombycis]
MLFRFLQALLGLLAIFPLASAYTNPVRNPGGSDPFVVYSGGYYYLLTTTWNDVQVSRATTIEGLKTAEKKVAYTTTEETHCCNVWAPEVHYLGDKWYIYYTAGNSVDLDGQNMHVLEGGATPWDDYTYAGQLTTAWGIDGSIVRFNDYGNFMVWSCFHGVTYQSLCIQQLGSDYISLTGDISVISEPVEDFETHGTPVNEGPAALYLDGKTHIAYSASYCWTSYYCVGLLTWDGATDPTDKNAWSKHDGCLLSSANGNYGTGHNSFFQSPDASQTWIAYHATTIESGACNDSRYAMVQEISSGTNGIPNLGEALAWTVELSEPSS